MRAYRKLLIGCVVLSCVLSKSFAGSVWQVHIYDGVCGGKQPDSLAVWAQVSPSYSSVSSYIGTGWCGNAYTTFNASINVDSNGQITGDFSNFLNDPGSTCKATGSIDPKNPYHATGMTSCQGRSPSAPTKWEATIAP